MNYEIVWSILFALIVWRALENVIDYAVAYVNERKRSKAFDKLLVQLDEALPFKPGDFGMGDCGDDDCDLCYDKPVAKKKTVKRAATKTKAVRKPVKKAAARRK